MIQLDGLIYRGHKILEDDKQSNWIDWYCPEHGKIWIRMDGLFRMTLRCPFCYQDDGWVDNELHYYPKGTIGVWEDVCLNG
jgi:hypothetical protein